MKIERDKHYRLRNGDRVRCICVDAHVDRPVIAVDGDGDILPLKSNGRYILGEDCPFDIVSEWTDPLPEWPDGMPAWAHWIAEDYDRRQFWYAGKPTANHDKDVAWRTCGGWGGIPDDYRVTFPDHLHWTERIISRPGVGA